MRILRYEPYVSKVVFQRGKILSVLGLRALKKTCHIVDYFLHLTRDPFWGCILAFVNLSGGYVHT